VGWAFLAGHSFFQGVAPSSLSDGTVAPLAEQRGWERGKSGRTERRLKNRWSGLLYLTSYCVCVCTRMYEICIRMCVRQSSLVVCDLWNAPEGGARTSRVATRDCEGQGITRKKVG
jgi:hypothetical protein